MHKFKNVEFLTKSNFNIKEICSELEQAIANAGTETETGTGTETETGTGTGTTPESEILRKLLVDFDNNDFSLLTPQICNWLNNQVKSKWPEYLIHRYKFKNFPIIKKVHDSPLHLLVEPVSSCNLRCTMCFQVDESFSGNSEFMGLIKLDLFKKVIDDACENNIKSLTLASRGEPTLHPKLNEMLEYCKGKFFEIKINTNATRLNEKLINSILKNDVTEMVFSIDSYEKDGYEKIRVGGIFEQVLDNIKKFKNIRDNTQSNCVSRVSGVKVIKGQNPEKFREFWQQYVDEVVMVDLIDRWDIYHNSKNIMNRNPCQILWEKLYVWYDGMCSPCDADYKSELSIGSLKNKSITDIWNGVKFQKLRQAHLSNNRNKYFPCDRCPNGS